jgi:hypothetical protein
MGSCPNDARASRAAGATGGCAAADGCRCSSRGATGGGTIGARACAVAGRGGNTNGLVLLAATGGGVTTGGILLAAVEGAAVALRAPGETFAADRAVGVGTGELHRRWTRHPTTSPAATPVATAARASSVFDAWRLRARAG